MSAESTRGEPMLDELETRLREGPWKRELSENRARFYKRTCLDALAAIENLELRARSRLRTQREKLEKVREDVMRLWTDALQRKELPSDVVTAAAQNALAALDSILKEEG